MNIDENFVVGALIVVVVLYFLCHKQAEHYLRGDSVDSADPLEKHLKSKLRAGENYVVNPRKKEKYLVDKYVVDKAIDNYVTEKYISDEDLEKAKQTAFEEKFVNDNRDIAGKSHAMTNSEDVPFPAVEHYGSNPLDMLTDADFTYGPFSSHNMEPYLVDKYTAENENFSNARMKNFWG